MITFATAKIKSNQPTPAYEDRPPRRGPHRRAPFHHRHQRLRATHTPLSLVRAGSHPRTEEHPEPKHRCAEGARGRPHPEGDATGRRGGAS